MRRWADRLYRRRYEAPDIHPRAHIDPTAKLGAECQIEAGAVVGAEAQIGDRCIISANAVIGPGVTLGHDCRIGANATVTFALVGDRVIIHGGAQIGQDGFGFASDAGGHTKIPQLGRVIVQDDVEIGANVTIDRGAADDTLIGAGTKIDDIVHIGHNCKIGRNCILVSMVGVSGSVTLGDNVVLAGKVGIADHVTIGDGATVAGRGGVISGFGGRSNLWRVPGQAHK